MGYAVVVVPATELDRGDRLPEIRREARWLGAAIVVEGAPSTTALNRLALEVPAPIFIVTDEALPAESGAVPGRWRLDVDVDELSADERRAVWETSLAEASLAPEVDLDVVAAHLRFGPARIVAAASAARHAADAEGVPVSTATILRAARQRSDPGRLARRLHRDHQLTDVVVPDATRRELELACTWVRHAGAAFRGPSAGRPLRGRSGLACLFHGPPGTGKTLAAQAIAGEVGLDLLSIDLSAVVDKYIGETEKNLSRAFDEAESTGAILFFDEADALFGKRSQVKDSHDRFANIETAFLLERVERHRGICILASNLRQNLDDAFTRRIRVIAEFPPPGPAERLAIWNLHVVRTELAGDVDLPALAQRFAICGGDINNAAATAVLLAASDGCAVAMRHLAIGVWRELRKAGRLVSPDDFGPWRDAIATYARASR
jgi:AAA+ superfamily predicted ATPase